MILQWYSSFDAAQSLWQLTAALLLLLTLGPGLAGRLNAHRNSMPDLLAGSQWLQGTLFLSGLWLLLLFSLTFGPSAGTMPDDDANASAAAPQSMESMIRDAAEMQDQRPYMGRGGLIGSFYFAGLRYFEAQGNTEQPLFAARRPWLRIPMTVLALFHLAVYLAAAAVVALQLQHYQLQPVRQLIFLTIWSALIYAPIIHWTWGEGWLGIRHVIDSGGGVLLLLCTGTAAGIAWGAGIPPRSLQPEMAQKSMVLPPAAAEALLPVGMVILAGALGVYSVPLRALAMLNVIAGGTGGLILTVILTNLIPRRMTAVSNYDGFVFGMLISICSAALISPMTAVVCGGAGTLLTLVLLDVAGLICRCFLAPVARMAIPLSLGMLLPGVFATSANGVLQWDGGVIKSLIHGSTELMLWQTLAMVSVLAWATIATAALIRVLRLSAVGPTRPESGGA